MSKKFITFSIVALLMAGSIASADMAFSDVMILNETLVEGGAPFTYSHDLMNAIPQVDVPGGDIVTSAALALAFDDSEIVRWWFGTFTLPFDLALENAIIEIESSTWTSAVGAPIGVPVVDITEIVSTSEYCCAKTLDIESAAATKTTFVKCAFLISKASYFIKVIRFEIDLLSEIETL